jgi:hypothetical protein
MKDIAGANGRFTKQQISSEGTSNGKVTLVQSRTVLSPPSGRFGSGSFAAPIARPAPAAPAAIPIPSPVARPAPAPGIVSESDHAPDAPVP